jgi:hypothetical protein
VVTGCLECLALANQVTFESHWARVVSESDRLDARPEGLKELAQTVTTAAEPEQVQAAAHRMVEGTRSVLRSLQETAPDTKKGDAPHPLASAYAEIREHEAKLQAACAAADAVRASWEARVLRNEIGQLLGAQRSSAGYGEFNRFEEYDDLYRDAGFADLADGFDPNDLGRTARLAETLDAQLLAWLDARGLRVNVFESTDGLIRWLESEE